MEKVVLAYSGGLDTSVILKWLIEEGYEVAAFVADVGQRENFSEVAAKAQRIGASRVEVSDLRREFVTDYIYPAVAGSAVYEGRYLLGTALARPLIAEKQIEMAKRIGASAVSHGATGKGNDQVRFELAYHALEPGIQVIAPWKAEKFLSQFKGRTDLINYAARHDIPVTATHAAPYSTDGNLMHISYEAGILEDPAASPPEDMFQMTVSPQAAPDCATRVEIGFEKGIPVQVNTERDPLRMFTLLNEMGGANGIGRIDIVENRYVGIKSRGVYETPGGTVLHAAHQDLQTMCLDREVLRIKEALAPRFAELIYNGYWFSPEMKVVRATFAEIESEVNGTVTLDLYKGNVIIAGRRTDSKLYDANLSSMDVEGGYDQRDAAGFIRINALRLKASAGNLRDA